MNYTVDNKNVIVGLEKGDEIFTSLYDIIKKEQWTAAQITGIGAVKNTELGYFDETTKDYQRKFFPDVAELISLTGNLTTKDNEPFLHLHGCFSGTDYQCYGGHCFSSEVAAVTEINMTLLDVNIERQFNPEIGLATCQFKN